MWRALASKLHDCKCASNIGNCRIKRLTAKSRPWESHSGSEKNAGGSLKCSKAVRRSNRIETHSLAENLLATLKHCHLAIKNICCTQRWLSICGRAFWHLREAAGRRRPSGGAALRSRWWSAPRRRAVRRCRQLVPHGCHVAFFRLSHLPTLSDLRVCCIGGDCAGHGKFTYLDCTGRHTTGSARDSPYVYGVCDSPRVAGAVSM